ncbi:MAG: cytochrome C [Alphaproteobacteria bacterium]|nr:cytochrome C [Alphaproteobacteria bacterium]MBU1515951.1 cytochrome C [Alphaproteobacteria bacterium]MBU2092834.1 cytochrome C [Alphaproteobacteria bacterium]MBU2153641.1 cytochrome C [Alphaproteobacteria bacterium]MBU2308269.1 cytochrome C [Alphaproteobacteria bacterium]
MRGVLAVSAGLAAMVVSACSKPEAPAGPPHVVAASDIEAGRYLAMIGSCNDCHTPGYPQSGGKTPETDRLVGNPVGYHGPWGTSYASNLRILAQSTTEDGWVELLKTKRLLPPMPTQNIAKMTETDLRNLYRYIHSLGAAGQAEPENLPPGVTPSGPYENMSVVAPKT